MLASFRFKKVAFTLTLLLRTLYRKRGAWQLSSLKNIAKTDSSKYVTKSTNVFYILFSLESFPVALQPDPYLQNGLQRKMKMVNRNRLISLVKLMWSSSVILLIHMFLSKIRAENNN